MKKTSICFLLTFFAIGANALDVCTWKDPSTGITWTYTTSGDTAMLGGDNANYPAVPKTTTGDLVVPAQINGLPVDRSNLYAFSNCSKLTSVTFPDGFRDIGQNTFSGCSSLKAVHLPTDLRTISSGAFQYCTSLASFSFPTGITVAADSLFYGCTGLVSVTFSKNFTSIGYRSFANCKGLEKIHLPDQLKKIDNEAFMGCARLATIDFPLYLTDVGTRAFANCTALQSLSIPLSIYSKMIGSYAFQNCTSLASVYFGDSIVELGYKVFDKCPKLGEGLVVTNGYVLCLNGSCPEKVELEWGTLVIAGGVFAECTGLKSISIPETVTRIGDKAFYGCTGLGQGPNKDGIVVADGWALCFNGTSCPDTLVLPESVEHVAGGAFYGCNKAKSVVWSKNLKELGYAAFQSCSGLTSISIPAGCNVRRAVFSGCSGATTVFIPPDVSIRDDVFVGCSGIRNVTVSKYATSLYSTFPAAYKYITNVVLADSVTTIPGTLFKSCAAITSITLPSQLKNVGDEAFKGLSKLESLTLPSSVTNVGASAFSGCTKLTKLALPESVRSIGTSAFQNSGITTITVPIGVKEINNYTFYKCTALKTVDLPYGIVRIGTGAFDSCSALAKLDLPNSLEEIGAGAFEYCSTLKQLAIPARVRDIPRYLCNRCTALETVTLPAGVTNMGYYAFYTCTALKSITLPPYVTYVNMHFSGSQAISDITLCQGTTTVGTNLFRNCRKLATVSIPDSVTTFSTDGFCGATNVQRIAFAGNAPNVTGTTQLADEVAPNCQVVVEKGSTGWKTRIPGKWQGISIVYSDGSEDDPLPDAFTQLDANATPAEVEKALVGTTDAKLMQCITNAADYSAFASWAAKVKRTDGAVAEAADVRASENAWVSFAIDSPTLLPKAPDNDDLSVESFEPQGTTGKFAFTVGIKDVVVGDQARETELKRLFGLSGGTSLDALSTDGVKITTAAPDKKGRVSLTAEPNTSSATPPKSYFMSIGIAPNGTN